MAQNTKIGDIFSIKIDSHSKKYIQYIISDATQLNSDVIRVFRTKYPIESIPDLKEVAKGEVEFCVHCVTKLGITLGYWQTEGNVNDVGGTEGILFRDSSDYGKKITFSDNWWLWTINQDQRFVGKLFGENRKAEIGIVVSPDSIVHRIKTGEYDFAYPHMNNEDIDKQ
ncbi:MAG: hypothetical protein JWQ38_1902 [Flavipsychrobacter sp.]|nr:hypothetical protein [Flavipsychrobacter sp.]